MTSTLTGHVQTPAATADTIRLALLPGEYLWGGIVDDGVLMPFRNHAYRCDLRYNLKGNQASPLLLSSKGRVIWSDEPFLFSLQPEDNLLLIHAGSSGVVCHDGHKDLRGAFCFAAKRFFPPSGAMPDPLNFTAPQYNSWIEMQYEPTQHKVLDYADQIISNGLPPGVLMIDDNWFEDHGYWRFHPGRFPNPTAMIQRLHDMGFRVMLWVSPFISPDGAVYRRLAKQKLLVCDSGGVPVVRRWWNGQSALLDVTHPGAVAWLHDGLTALMDEYAVDGFKFDAGDPEYFLPGDRTHTPTDAVGYCEAWGRIGLEYRFNEYRACWKLAGQPLIQRLRDKYHEWGRSGLADFVPNGLAQGLAGYSFICPDMVGGGDIASFTEPDFVLDQELFVRTVQASALFPIMQFSIAPWRVLDAEHWGYCRDAIRLRQELTPYLSSLAEHAAQTGEPILRHLSYVFPDSGLEEVNDQFLLGSDILVAPVVTQGAKKRSVIFPPGLWQGDDGLSVQGPSRQDVDSPISRLPWYRRIQ